MFRRIIHENWAAIVPIISFVVTASVFVFATIRALRLPKERRDSLAAIPLNETPTSQSSLKTEH